MKVLVGAACIAVIAFVGYYFWNEYRTSQRAYVRSYEGQTEICNDRIRTLKSWKDGTPDGKVRTFSEARDNVEQCFQVLSGTNWYRKNINIKYW